MEFINLDESSISIIDNSGKYKGHKPKFSFDKTEKTMTMTVSPSFHNKFEPQSLKDDLNLKIFKIKSSPIEYEEIKLYKQTRFFYSYLGGIKFDIEIIGKVHHLISLQKINFVLKKDESAELNEQMHTLTSEDSYIFHKYKLLSKILDLCGRLMVKWKIFKVQNYEFRYSGRGLNVKLLDLEKTSKTILSIDTFWFAFGIFSKPLCDLAESNLLEIAKVLKQSASELFFDLLSMNVPNPNYKIKEFMAYKSRKYKKFNSEVMPEVNVEEFKYQSLNYKKGFFSKCFGTDTVLDQIYEKMTEFELAFREFERELIITLLGTSKYVANN